ncbi:MAG: alpha/beta fold hydrolase [Deltaproteobacteria bacterium]|jgi:pimeloyl-ACP methyl ester carboxylesterase|nr:alpha/beta fold hydrolase [Deltaproteobacteria bacterium]
MKIFLHGLESSSRGAKASFLRQLYPDMVMPDFSGSLSERMKTLCAVLNREKNIILIGSSFGGLMATIFAMEHHRVVNRVILLAPALNFPEFSRYTMRPLDIPARMIIGQKDTVTPPEKVIPMALKIFTALQYDIVDDNHLLADTFRNLDWEAMLSG